MKACIFTLGCKVNEVESATMAAALEENGWEVTDKLSYADIYILNTCAVTREAEKKSRQLVARARKFNPSARIFVCGCAVRKDASAFESKGVYFVTGARDKSETVKAVFDLYGGECACQPYPKQSKTRAFIKIQDGCNNFCSYCIIPYLRGREVSRPIAEIAAEVAACDCPEIVLTGINISSYDDGGTGLTGLIEALSDVKKRIRLGSLECSVITDGFLSALKKLPDFAPQFHLSLQSGSSAVLKAMNRRYTREEYLKKCEMIYSYFPDGAVTTDIISGFPTETERDFAESLSIISEVGFARVHAFSYSPREGTAAYKLKDLPPDVKNDRLSSLLAAAKEAEKKYVLKHMGSTFCFIAEEFKDGMTSGYTGNYIKVYLNGEYEAGKKYNVKLVGLRDDGAIAVTENENQEGS